MYSRIAKHKHPSAESLHQYKHSIQRYVIGKYDNKKINTILHKHGSIF